MNFDFSTLNSLDCELIYDAIMLYLSHNREIAAERQRYLNEGIGNDVDRSVLCACLRSVDNAKCVLDKLLPSK